MANATAGRIVILAVAIVVLWLGGAVAGTLIGAYPTFSEAVWDAIWHMLDPGALGDDATTKQRALGVALTIAGLIILAGAALTLFEELVERALGRLGAADPPLSIRDHLLVIGANKTLTAIVRRVADEGPEGGRPVVVLVPPGDSAARRNLARELAAEAGRARVRVVGGELADDGLERVCAADAARIVVLAPPDLDPEIADLRVLGVGARLASAIEDERRPPVSLQMSRGRNVDVVWDQFPEGFDALVEDRATAAILALCLAHPAFSGILSGLDDRGAIVFREDLEGRTFASIVEDDADFIPIAVARGSGESLNPSFAPPPDRPVEPGEVVVAAGGGPGEDETRAVPGGVGGADADDGLGERVRRTAAAADMVTYEPLPSGPRRLLIVGWSDAAASFVGEMLGLTGVAELAVLDEQRPGSLPERIGDITPSFIRGRPDEPADLAAAVETANPDAILVAASREGDAAAAFTALRLERHFRAGAGSQAVRRPAIVVQQSEADGAGRLRMGLEWTHVVSSAELTGQTVGYSAGSPETLAVLERMAEGGMHRVVIAPGAESPDGKQQHPGFDFATVYRRLLQDGMAPFALVRDGRLIDFSLDAGTAIRPGDEFLVVRRNDGPPA